MLKLTYTETGLQLEPLSVTVEEWITSRVVLSVRATHPLMVEAATASVLLPLDLPSLETLKTAAAAEALGAIAFSQCDAEFLEVTLRGTWLSSHPEREEGVFVVTLSPATEALLYQLWRVCQLHDLGNALSQ
ncbi:MAG TPA: hypothetical protein IGS37_08475 [Synechococcales cyanobacterium M55_K2018_004]|nr:hypothetical protein [Synechococcales cyanobacterium M55_K2018_004]